MKRLLVAGAVLAATTPFQPAPALSPSGCAVAVSGFQSLPTRCTFLATGPFYYTATSTSGWRIARSRDGGPWVELARSATNEVRPTHVSASAGSLPAQGFDVIELSIVRANESTPVGTISYQHGIIAATSDL